MDIGSTEIIFNPENVTSNLIIISSTCEVFPLSEGEENNFISQFIGKCVVFLQETNSLDLNCLYSHCTVSITKY